MSQLIINKIEIPLGTTKELKLPVGKIASGQMIYVRTKIFRSPKPGPVILLMGGLHGDEINGVEIVRQFSTSEIPTSISKGTIITIPCLNTYGFINFSRDTPDGKDVNRSFPGHTQGSLSARIARVITKKILPIIDFGIDFHTGGASRYNYPQIRYSKNDVIAQKLAIAFAAPYTIEKNIIPKSFRSAAKKLDIPIIVFEGGESLRYDDFSIQIAFDGIKRILKEHGMLKTAPKSKIQQYFVKTTWIRASKAGLFQWKKKSGDYIHIGELIGVISDPYGNESYDVISKLDGYLIGHNNASVVNMGDPLFHVGLD